MKEYVSAPLIWVRIPLSLSLNLNFTQILVDLTYTFFQNGFYFPFLQFSASFRMALEQNHARL